MAEYAYDASKRVSVTSRPYAAPVNGFRAVPGPGSFFHGVRRDEYLEGARGQLDSFASLGVTAALLAGIAFGALVSFDADVRSTASSLAAVCWAVGGGLNLVTVIIFSLQFYYGALVAARSTLYLQELHVGHFHDVVERHFLEPTRWSRTVAEMTLGASMPCILLASGLTALDRYRNWVGTVILIVMAAVLVVMTVAWLAMSRAYGSSMGVMLEVSKSALGPRFANFGRRPLPLAQDGTSSEDEIQVV